MNFCLRMYLESRNWLDQKNKGPLLADSGIYLDLQYQGGMKSTVSRVFEDLKFKISEGYKQN